MPQRIRRMHNDGINFAVSTGVGSIAWWLSAFSALLPILWVIYVLCLIVAKLPEVHRAVVRISVCVHGRWNRFKEWKRGSKN